MTVALSVLYPELCGFAPAQRAGALRAARRAPLDAVELLGIAAGLIVAMLLARYAMAGSPAAAQAAIALATLSAAAAPFLLRRTRRGLRRLLDREPAAAPSRLGIAP